jgi:HTH-type transcriptional regulator/antitoxin HipB
VRLRTPRELGLRIRDRRLHLGWSQAELAERIGMTRQWVIGLEKGSAGVALGTVLRTLVELGLVLDVREPYQYAGSSGVMTARERIPVDQIRRFVDSVGARDYVSERASDAGSVREPAPGRTPLRPAKGE